jgi:hypothetical protein
VSYEFVPFADKEGRPIAENGTLLPESADAALSIKVENAHFGEAVVAYPLAHVVRSARASTVRPISAGQD